jgi:23S rRNA (adenine2503-C2)-methyltransferase
MDTNHKDKRPLLAYSVKELEELALANGFKAFNGRQIYTWIHRKNAIAFDSMTDLSNSFRTILSENYFIGIPETVETLSVSDITSTTKFLFKLHDGHLVECVYIPTEDRSTVCLSCQVGCAYKCTFCATGKLGLKRNMTAYEIVGTFLAIRSQIPNRISNVVFMGMGEPLANMREVMSAWEFLTNPDGIGLSRRKVTISTVGLPEKIRKLAEYPYPPKLVFSIASPYDEVRKKVLPIAGKFSLQQIHESLSYYADKTRNRITIALIVADGLNDKLEDARALSRWIGNLPAKINLLRYNETDGSYSRANEDAIERIASELVRLNRTVVLRQSRGGQIAAACGQLAAQRYSK